MSERAKQMDQDQVKVRAFYDAMPTGDSVEDKRTRLIIRLSLMMKNTEICNLKTSDMWPHTGDGCIHVRLCSGRIRKFPVDKELAEQIIDYFENARPKTVPQSIGQRSTQGWFFYHRRRKLTRRVMQCFFERISKQAGLEGFAPAKLVRSTWWGEGYQPNWMPKKGEKSHEKS
jgi:site-specific recombinase XerD